jgi:hypothetical protein
VQIRGQKKVVKPFFEHHPPALKKEAFEEEPSLADEKWNLP